MKRAIAVALFSVALLGTGHAEEVADAYDLLSVYEHALQNDPQIREAEANRRAVQEARPQAWAALLPQLSGALQASRNKAEGTEPFFTRGVEGVQIQTVPSERETDTDGYSLELRQSVFSWSNWMALRRANSQVAQAEADYQAAQQDLILRVSQRYFDVLAARDSLDAEQAALEAISRQLEQAEKRFEVGLIAITDVQEARAARDNAAAAVIAAKRQLATAEELLREITNQQYTVLAKPGPDMPLLTPDPADPERWVAMSMEQNLALVSARLAADIARSDVGIARGGHYPSIDIVATRSDTTSDVDSLTLDDDPANPGQLIPRQSLFTQENLNDRISLQITVPIFSGGLTQSRVRESQFRWIAARERVERVSRETERLARDAYLGVISEIARVKALRQALESSQTALKATEAGYEVGTRTAVDVLDARRTLVQAQTNYARSRYDYILNVIRLRLAAGTLDPQTLAQINDWLTAAEAPAPGTVPSPQTPGQITPPQQPAPQPTPPRP